MSIGVCYVAYGANAVRECGMSIRALRHWHDWPVTVIGEKVIDADQYIEFKQRDDGGRWAKITADRLSPYECTLYLDADTRPRGNLEHGFELLSNGWDMAITTSEHQNGHDYMWHIDEKERNTTMLELGYQPLQLQGGMMFFRKSARIHALFAAWRNEWVRWRDKDQAALARALARVPVRLWILGAAYNGGALIAHLHGKARAR